MLFNWGYKWEWIQFSEVLFLWIPSTQKSSQQGLGFMLPLLKEFGFFSNTFSPWVSFSLPFAVSESWGTEKGISLGVWHVNRKKSRWENGKGWRFTGYHLPWPSISSCRIWDWVLTLNMLTEKTVWPEKVFINSTNNHSDIFLYI